MSDAGTQRAEDKLEDSHQWTGGVQIAKLRLKAVRRVLGTRSPSYVLV